MDSVSWAVEESFADLCAVGWGHLTPAPCLRALPLASSCQTSFLPSFTQTLSVDLYVLLTWPRKELPEGWMIWPYDMCWPCRGGIHEDTICVLGGPEPSVGLCTPGNIFTRIIQGKFYTSQQYSRNPWNIHAWLDRERTLNKLTGIC